MDAQSLPAPSAWELDLGTARFTLTLSPGHSRGFSGEGALLGSLADDGVTADAELMSVLLAWSPRIDIGRLSAEAGLSPERTVLALTRLAASAALVTTWRSSRSSTGNSLSARPWRSCTPAWPARAR